MRSMRSQYRAFTLIELLVVMGIISILLSLLMPCLSAAKERGRRVVCANNLRNIWTGILSYSMVYDDRLPYLEDINRTQPNADPFSLDYPASVGTVLESYITEGSWHCPSAVAGYPANVGSGGWKLTYKFTAAGSVGPAIPYDAAPGAYTGSIGLGSDTGDPALQNYDIFDGRPMKLLDGRRYVTPPDGLNQNKKGRWTVRFPIVADLIAQQSPSFFSPLYPHRGRPEARLDLGNAKSQFETNTNTARSGKTTGYNELHADGEEAVILFTRNWQQHPPGF